MTDTCFVRWIPGSDKEIKLWTLILAVVLSMVCCSDVLAEEPRGQSGPGQTHAGDCGCGLTRGLLAVGGILTLTTFDQRLRGYFQDNHTQTRDDVADALERLGEWPVYGGISGSLLSVGLVSGNEPVRRAGLRVASTVAITMLFARGVKHAVGRSRPLANRGSNVAESFSSDTSFPSGHTSMTFALAASLSHEIDRRWATVSLYSLAFGTGWSRLYHDRHWTSDVVAGAALGYYTAKLVQFLWSDDNGVLIAPQTDGFAWSWSRSF